MLTISLGDVDAATQVGGKAQALARMYQAGIPVPHAFCVTAAGMGVVTSRVFSDELVTAISSLDAKSVAVRSSALGEDGRAASFAGVHFSALNVPPTAPTVVEQLQRVAHSARSEGAAAYRSALGLSEESGVIAAVVQRMVAPRSAGVMFTAHPVTGSGMYIIESNWGLAQTVVDGMVAPDRITADPSGKTVEWEVGDKQTMAVFAERGTKCVAVEPTKRTAPSLTSSDVSALIKMGRQCEALFGRPQDVEWAIEGDALWVLQSRPISA